MRFHLPANNIPDNFVFALSTWSFAPSNLLANRLFDCNHKQKNEFHMAIVPYSKQLQSKWGALRPTTCFILLDMNLARS